MGLWELFLIGVGISMDAFAVSVCKGRTVQKLKAKNILIVGAYFGGFQALMPLIGYFVGSRFETLITSIDHSIVYILLSIIGVNKIRESREEEKLDDDYGFKKMITLADPTCFDALPVAFSFAFLDVKIVPAVCLIGATTFILSAIGIKVGNAFGLKDKSASEGIGGVILILIGIKILIEHLFFK